MSTRSQSPEPQRPLSFGYLDIVDYLNDYFKYAKLYREEFSVRKFASLTGINQGHISKILNRHATLTTEVLQKMIPHLNVNQDEAAFLFLLRDLSESRTQDERVGAFKKIIRNKKFKSVNRKNIVEHEFLSNWYYPAIHELARLPDFELDAKWVKGRLSNKITLGQAMQAINFLVKNEYLVVKNEKVEVAEKEITCTGGIFRIAASEYHSQLLEIARDSIYSVDRDLRHLISQTIAMPQDNISKVKDILDKAVEKISLIPIKDEDRNSVYQISLLAVPLAEARKSNGES